MSDEVGSQSDVQPANPPPGRPRSPLIIGGISCGLIVWMVLVIFLLVAWKYFTTVAPQ